MCFAQPPRPFKPGKIMATRAVDAFISTASIQTEIHACMRRHLKGDWGELCAIDVRLNDAATNDGSRILSSYRVGPAGTRIWIITEADRSTTTVLFPSEY